MTDTLQLVKLCIQSKQPVLIWGPPGIGKTAMTNALGETMDMPVVTVIASIREPSDFAGLPVVRPEGVEFAPPVWAKELLKYGRAILFLDELTLAPRAVQAALLRVVLERQVGDLYLGDDVAIVCAANPPEMSAGGIQLTGPFGNRMSHHEMTLDTEAWRYGLSVGRWGKGHVSQDHERAASLIAAFIGRNASALFRYPKAAAQVGRAWPSPRSWDAAHRLLATCFANGLTVKDDTVTELLVGAVGESAHEFIRWAIDMDLIDPEDALKDPTSCTLPTRGDKLSTLLTSCSIAAIRKMDGADGEKQMRDRWNACWKLYMRVDVDHTLDGVRVLMRNTPKHTGLPVEASKRFLPVFKAAGLIQVTP